MTQITGKIYQQTNAAGTENRFPRTVMEAVLGLNSYLQNQFSALADIYMPIEGITETKQGQEFVYRACPSTIRAKSLTIDRIKGKTLAWNQGIVDGNFAHGLQYVTNETVNVTSSVSNGVLSVTTTQTNVGVYLESDTPISGHKYYCHLEYTATAPIMFRLGGFYSSNLAVTSDMTSVSVIGDANILGNSNIYAASLSDGQCSFQIKNVIVIDLTLLYGSEIDGLTDAQILAKFESEYPGYHDYSAGKLISNDAESIETVGFNQWDEEWESGTIDNSGINSDYGISVRIRSKNYCACLPNTTYYVYCANNYTNTYIKTFWYNANKEHLKTGYSEGELISPANAAYFRITTEGENYGNTYHHDICINLSDPAKNGTYEPYWKREAYLGLDSLKVKSHNIWDEEWELGTIDSNGAFVASDSSIRGKNYYPVQGGKTYRFTGGNAVIYCYDANKTFIPYTGQTGSPVWQRGMDITNNTFIIPSGTFYIRFCMSGAYGTTYNNDVCINVSSSFNGRYEPHGEITINGLDEDCYAIGSKYNQGSLNVNLGDLDWIDTLTYGEEVCFYSESLASIIKHFDDSVVANVKCSKYVVVGRNAQWGAPYADKVIAVNHSGNVFINDSAYANLTPAQFKAAMDGVMLNFQLATPIEYELVEPLVLTTKAGTTEARISPNSDGLSAPMVCDMTYSASENNDAGNAQFASVAGRLYNARKIWGQDFDGSQDVVGAMSSVTKINDLLYFKDGSIGVGIATTPQAKFHVNGTFKASGDATFGGTLTVSGATLLNGPMRISSVASPSAAPGIWGSEGSGSLFFYATGQFRLYDGSGFRDIFHTGNANLSTVNWSSAVNKSLGLRIHGTAENLDVNVYYTAIKTVYEQQSPNYLNGALVFYTMHDSYTENSETEKMRLSSVGNLLIGTPTDNGYKLDVSGTFRATGTATFGSTIHATGGIDSDSYITAGAANASSDARLKSSISPVQNAIDVIMALKPSEWVWNEKHFLNGQKGAGLVAQEVQSVLPFAVTHETDYLALNYNVFHAYEIAAIQYLVKRVQELESKLLNK